MSQLDLALEAEISQRHLSFVENGRSAPSRDMVLKLAEQLDVPLRERNTLLMAAGYAPCYSERALGDTAMAPVREAVERVLAAHEPWPALAIDRHWNMAAANGMIGPMIAGVAPRLLAPPVNVLRLSLARDGLQPRIENFAEWRAHLVDRLRRQRTRQDDPILKALYEEAMAGSAPQTAHGDGIAVALRMRFEERTLAFWSMTMVFGAPLDVSLSEIAIETFLPADAETAHALSAVAASLR